MGWLFNRRYPKGCALYVLAAIWGFSAAFWILALLCQAELYCSTADRGLFGLGAAAGRLIVTHQRGVAGQGSRYPLDRRLTVRRVPFQRSARFAADFNLWRTAPIPGDLVEYDRLIQRWSVAGLAWDSGGKASAGEHVAYSWEIPDPRLAHRVVSTGPPRLPAPIAPAVAGERLDNRWWVLTIPVWPLVLLTTPAPIRLISKKVRSHRATMNKQRGCCASCGYDVRGLNYRCPECGTPTSESEEVERFHRSRLEGRAGKTRSHNLGET